MRALGLGRGIFLACYFVMLSTCAYLAFSTITLDKLEVSSRKSVAYQAIWISLYAWLCLDILLTRHGPSRILRNMAAPVLLLAISAFAYARGGVSPDAALKLIMFGMTTMFAAWLALVAPIEETFELFYHVASAVAVFELALFPFMKDYTALYDQLERTTILGLSPYSGLFGHKNLAGGFFGLSIVIRLAYFHRMSLLRNPVRCVLFLAQIVCFVWSGAVTSAVAVAIAGVFMACLKLLRKDRTLGILAVCAAGGAVIGATIFLSPILELFGRDAALSGRDNIYQIWPQFFWRRPLFGYGYGEFFSMAEDAPSIALNRLLQWGGVVTFESGYLQCLIDFGLLGGFVFAYVIAKAAATSVKIANTKSTHRDAPLALMAFILCASAAANFIELHNTVFPVMLFYLFFGPRLSIARREHRTRAPAYAVVGGAEQALVG